jgi:hypothetical protein
MNQKFFGPMFIENEEVGVAYQKAFEMVLDHPELSKWGYIFTCEEDNVPESDTLLKLYESIKDFDCVGALYWTKSNSTSDCFSQPMIYGNVNEKPMNFIPQAPLMNQVQPCNGLGMGCNLWKISSFKKKLKDMDKPYFKTLQERTGAATQDLYFFSNAAKFGFKCACDTRAKCGHLDVNTGMVW